MGYENRRSPARRKSPSSEGLFVLEDDMTDERNNIEEVEEMMSVIATQGA